MGQAGIDSSAMTLHFAVVDSDIQSYSGKGIDDLRVAHSGGMAEYRVFNIPARTQVLFTQGPAGVGSHGSLGCSEVFKCGSIEGLQLEYFPAGDGGPVLG